MEDNNNNNNNNHHHDDDDDALGEAWESSTCLQKIPKTNGWMETIPKWDSPPPNSWDIRWWWSQLNTLQGDSYIPPLEKENNRLKSVFSGAMLVSGRIIL